MTVLTGLDFADHTCADLTAVLDTPDQCWTSIEPSPDSPTVTTPARLIT